MSTLVYSQPSLALGSLLNDKQACFVIFYNHTVCCLFNWENIIFPGGIFNIYLFKCMQNKMGSCRDLKCCFSCACKKKKKDPRHNLCNWVSLHKDTLGSHERFQHPAILVSDTS